jgi:hypothetical protein
MFDSGEKLMDDSTMVIMMRETFCRKNSGKREKKLDERSMWYRMGVGCIPLVFHIVC